MDVNHSYYEAQLVLNTQMSDVLDIAGFPTFINEHYPSLQFTHDQMVRSQPDTRSEFWRRNYPNPEIRLPPTEERLLITLKLSDMHKLINRYSSVEKFENRFIYNERVPSPSPRPHQFDDYPPDDEDDSDDTDNDDNDLDEHFNRRSVLSSIGLSDNLSSYNNVSNTATVTYMLQDNLENQVLELEPENITSIEVNGMEMPSREVAMLSFGGRIPYRNMKNWLPKKTIRKKKRSFRKRSNIQPMTLQENEITLQSPLQVTSPKFEEYNFKNENNYFWSLKYPSLRSIVIDFDRLDLVFSCNSRHNEVQSDGFYIHSKGKRLAYKEYHRKKKKFNKIATSSKAMKNFIKIERFICSTRFYKFNNFVFTLGFENFLSNFYSFEKLRNFLLNTLQGVQQNLGFIKSSFTYRGSKKAAHKLKEQYRHILSNKLIKDSKYYISFKETKEKNIFSFYIKIRYNYDSLTTCIKKDSNYSHVELLKSLKTFKDTFLRIGYKPSISDFRFQNHI